jgi:uncharacterized membrane protein (UPF0136 family)
MTGSAHAAYTVGGISVAGGLFAFYKKKSVASLLGSLIIGGGLIAGGYLITTGDNFVGHSLAATSSVGLTAVGISRLLTTKKSMPAAPMIILGGLSSAYQLTKANDWK